MVTKVKQVHFGWDELSEAFAYAAPIQAISKEAMKDYERTIFTRVWVGRFDKSWM